MRDARRRSDGSDTDDGDRPSGDVRADNDEWKRAADALSERPEVHDRRQDGPGHRLVDIGKKGLLTLEVAAVMAEGLVAPVGPGSPATDLDGAAVGGTSGALYSAAYDTVKPIGDLAGERRTGEDDGDEESRPAADETQRWILEQEG